MKSYFRLCALILWLSTLAQSITYAQECTLRPEYNRPLGKEQLATRQFTTSGFVYGMRGSGPNQFMKVGEGEQQLYYFAATLIFPTSRKTFPEDSVLFYFTDGTRLKAVNVMEQKSTTYTPIKFFPDMFVDMTHFLCHLTEDDVRTLATKSVKKITFYIGSEVPLYSESLSRRDQKRYDKIAGRKVFSIRHVNHISRRRMRKMAQCIL